MKQNTISKLLTGTLLLFIYQVNGETISWKSPEVIPASNTSKQLYYFQIPGSTLDQEFVEDVLEDSRIQQLVSREFTPVLFTSDDSTHAKLFRKYGIYSTPTLLIIEPNKDARKITREIDREKILSFLEGKELAPESQLAQSVTGSSEGSENVLFSNSANYPQSPNQDIIKWTIQQKGTSFVSTLTVAGEIDGMNVTKYLYLIDADANPKTGYTEGVITGAEYLVQGDLLYTHNPDLGGWNWNQQSSAPYSFSGPSLFHTITIPGVNQLPKSLWAMTQDATWAQIDVVLANGYSLSNLDLQQPDSTVAASQSTTGTSVVARQQFFTDPLDSTSGVTLDLTNIFTAMEGDKFKVALKFQQSITQVTAQLFLDVDNNPQTGFLTLDKSGADFMLEGTKLHRFSGTTNDEWKWDAVENLESLPIDKGLIFEIARSRAAIKADQPLNFWVTITGSNWEAVDYFPNVGVATFTVQGN